jgi:site-specific DNA recombinase
MDCVTMYLRKSRADLEAEAQGEGETLEKHKKMLLKIAKEKDWNIEKIFEEVVSGDSILHRPQMLQLLQEVGEGRYDAVLCVDIDRLGRGDKQEQGLIEKTFKESNTKIITLRKTYDLNDEFDEEYMEFETFMARKEYKIIKRRLQRSRVQSVEEGNYIGTYPPFGYVIKDLGKNGRTLEPHPEQAPIVKMIFEWYTHDDPAIRMGASAIANKLNELGYRTATGKQWYNSAVLNIIKNAVYAGRIQWKKREQKPSLVPGKRRDTRKRSQDEWIDVPGKHQAIVSQELFEKAQDILKGRYHVPYQLINGITNPLAGIVKCGKCGASMVYRPYTKQKPHLKCYNNPRCDNKASNFELVEKRLIDSLRLWLETYKANWADYQPEEDEQTNIIELKQAALKRLERELIETQKQKWNLYDLLERGIYDEKTFIERSNYLADKIDELERSITQTKEELALEQEREQAKVEIIPQVEHVLELYHKTDDPKLKNSLLKSVLEKAVYRKEKHQWQDDFTLILYPKLPKSPLD